MYLKGSKAWDLISKKFDKAEPFSMIRLGDGENSIIQYPNYCTKSRIQYVMSRALEGREYQGHEINNIKFRILDAINDSDLLGIYSSKEENVLKRFYIDYLEGELELLKNTFCDPNIHFYLQTHGCIEDLLSRCDSVSVISGRDVAGSIERLYPGKLKDYVLIPSERNFRLLGEQASSEHYPYVFEETIKGIKVYPGRHLFLVGAGFLGKIYCSEIKKRGGFALDIGSVLDYWAGVPSREAENPVVDGVLKSGYKSLRKNMAFLEKNSVHVELGDESFSLQKSPSGLVNKFSIGRLEGQGYTLCKEIPDRGLPLPFGGIISWLTFTDISQLKIIDRTRFVHSLDVIKNFISQSGTNRTALLCLASEKDLTEQDSEFLSENLNRFDSTYFFDFRVYKNILSKQYSNTLHEVDLKLFTSTDFGLSSGFVLKNHLAEALGFH